MPDPYYITTPIYYVNDRPHIGHCYTTVVADVAARFQRLIRGSSKDVFFLTGTDEHADKVVKSAGEHAVSPQEWADRNAEEFRRAFRFMGVSNDDFIRTTEPRHREKVGRYIAALMRSGDIYRGEYTGWYDEGQEEYVTENAAREAGFKSVISGRPLVKRTEPCYFFRLSKYQERLEQHITSNPHFIQPDARRSEVLGRIRLGFNDVPVSRPVTDDPATRWGIRIPGDDAHRIYVWIDALFNYLSTIDTLDRRRFWPADIHLIGKDILWFHAAIWPCLLMALRDSSPDFKWVELPGTIFGHGWWISEGQKMSKSLGNFIDLERLQAYADRYSLDALRWYLATQGPLAGNDADFSHAKFVEVYNADLANGIGNSTSRVANMIEKYFAGSMPDPMGVTSVSPTDLAYQWPNSVPAALDVAVEAVDALRMSEAMGAGAQLVKLVDGYINTTQPFRIAKQRPQDPFQASPQFSNREVLGMILYHCAEVLRVASLLLCPAMPTRMAELWRRWSCNHLNDPGDPDSGFVAPLEELARWGGPHSLKPGTRIEKGDPLFMRIIPDEPAP